MTLLWALLLMVSTVSGGSQLQVSERSCPRILEDGSLLDCEEDLSVSLELLMVSREEPGACERDGRGCQQTFIVRCDDFWSQQHGTEYAMLINEATNPQQRLAGERLPGPNRPLTLHVRRDFHCDQTPFEGGFGSDCLAWDCFPECCRIFSDFIDVYDGSEVLVDDLERFGSLPCLRLEHDR